MHNPTKNAYNPGLVFRVLQYFDSDINIYPTAIIILKFWVVLEQTSSKKKVRIFSDLKNTTTLYVQDDWLKI